MQSKHASTSSEEEATATFHVKLPITFHEDYCSDKDKPDSAPGTSDSSPSSAPVVSKAPVPLPRKKAVHSNSNRKMTLPYPPFAPTLASVLNARHSLPASI